MCVCVCINEDGTTHSPDPPTHTPHKPNTTNTNSYGKEFPVDALDADLNTPLHCAIVHGHADAARALVHDLKVGVYGEREKGVYVCMYVGEDVGVGVCPSPFSSLTLSLTYTYVQHHHHQPHGPNRRT